MNKPEFQNRYQLSIEGQWRDASDGKFFTTKCPANGEKLVECTQVIKKDVDDTVRETWKAFEAWKKVPTSERATTLNKIAGIIGVGTEHLAVVESLDNGEPIRKTMAIDIPLSTKHSRYFAGCIMAEEGGANILDERFLSLILREPIGVVGQVVLWNFPFLMAVRKLAPVLAAGCCTVFKPSSDTSLPALEFTRLVQDVIPKGVFNVITGSGSRSDQYMLSHKGFKKLAFTGSTEVGRQVVLVAAGRLIPATLELGGKSTSVFFSDCNWEQTIDDLQLDTLFNQGQIRYAGSRVFVHEDICDRLLEDAVKASNNAKVGVSWDPETQVGSRINEHQLEKTLSYVEAGKQEGVRLICGDGRITGGKLAKNCFMRPALLVNVTNDIWVVQEKIFGPVACILEFRDKDEIIHMANDNVYGLGGTVRTHDLNHATRVSRGIETGRIWVDAYNQIPEGSPLGGYKESGIGHETHKVILEYYTQMKDIMISLSEAPSGFHPAKQNLTSVQQMSESIYYMMP